MLSINFCITSRTKNVSEALCRRPKYFKSVSFKPCTPRETLLIPADLKSLILFNSKFVGFDSNVISIHLSKLKSLFINNKIFSTSFGGIKEGVPPPRKIELNLTFLKF